MSNVGEETKSITLSGDSLVDQYKAAMREARRGLLKEMIVSAYYMWARTRRAYIVNRGRNKARLTSANLRCIKHYRSEVIRLKRRHEHG